ncbi:MAG: 16S rRNA (guanine(527)-N(7))-methyltransferase RsmG [Acidobacteriales bacterium]|nr:16S rRNA (guanine(527)-N(7))-methyltransferase RsmG [Terriglobales bacterium]
MESTRIRELLAPFLKTELSPAQIESLASYMDLLLRWNQRINLTSVHAPEEIVTRHFGESLFLAQHLFPSPESASAASKNAVLADKSIKTSTSSLRVMDVGSGAGFPGLPIKIWASQVQLTLIEANHKKATFLREAVRTLKLTDVEVFAGRAEDFPGRADVICMRAVERCVSILPEVANLVAAGGQLALAVGESQVVEVRNLLPQFNWFPTATVPISKSRVLLIGSGIK